MGGGGEVVEHVDVLVVGAGLSGVGAGCYLERECPWASYAVLEARESMGGTWDLFRYPGIRSDSDMFTLGYSFRPWPHAESLGGGADILQYIKDTAAEYGVDRNIRFGHRVLSADWSTPDACWRVKAEKVESGEVVELTAGFVFACSGYYRYDHGYLPDFAGMDRFEGTLVHPQKWPADLDFWGKRVVVIGSGATAVTLIPSLAETAAHVTMLQRSPTYIGSIPAKNPLPRLIRRLLPERQAGAAIKWVFALMTQGFYKVSRRYPAIVKRLMIRLVTKELPKGYDVATHFTPRYNPWDQRVCAVPDGDLFKVIADGRASVVTDTVDTFTEKGIRLSSGTELEADIVVTATGLELLFLGGVEVSIDGSGLDLPSRLAYKGMMLEDVPNMAFAIGYTNASWTLKCDLTCDYVCRLLNRMHETGQRQCMPHNSDPSMGTMPILGLQSGYIQRAAHLLPRQGSRYPWQVKQSYLADYRALKLGSIDDSAMQFSNPDPNLTSQTVAVAS